jgi:hypothetical protein
MAAITWDGRTFAFDVVGRPLNNEPSLKRPPGASDKFTFVPSEVVAPPYLFTITPETAGSIAPFWVGIRLLPQNGPKLRMSFSSGTKLETRVKRAQKKIEKHPSHYERLVGFSPLSGNNDPVEFYQIPKGALDGVTSLLIVTINFIGASPRGIVSGNG